MRRRPDLRSAVQVIYHRANAMKGTLGGGRMMVVGASAEELQPMLGPSLEISVVNSHVSCVVSGERAPWPPWNSAWEKPAGSPS